MNIDILKDYLSEEDFLSLSEKLGESDIFLTNKTDDEDKVALLDEINALKKTMTAREKIGIALAGHSPVDFGLALSLIDPESFNENEGADVLVTGLKEKHPSLFNDYFKKPDMVTSSLPHKGHLPDRENMSDKDYYDSIFKKNN